MREYVSKMIDGFRDWMLKKKAERIVLVLCDAVTDERFERWQFDLKLDDENIAPDALVYPHLSLCGA